MLTALITGATAGIGHAFTEELASRGYDLILVARDTQRMENQATELRSTYGVNVEVLTADLTNRAQLNTVANRLADDSRPIDLLVNNAGFGIASNILESDVEQQENMLALLCNAVLVLCHAGGNTMKRRATGTIINVSSVAGFTALGSYAAAKSWATTFSEALHQELQEHGVHVMALCPGFVRTEFHERANLTMDTLPESWWLNSRDLVRAALNDADRSVIISVPTVRYKALSLVSRHMPRPLVRAFSSKVRTKRDPNR